MVDEQVFPNWVLTLAVRLLGGKGKASTTEKFARVGKTKGQIYLKICTFSRAWETALRAEGVLSDLLLAIVRITQLGKPSEGRNKREVQIGLFRRVFKSYLLI